MPCKPQRQFYGTATLGEKGQIVIPAEAREAMEIGKGDKLLAFGMGTDMLVFSKAAHLEQFAAQLEKRLADIRELISKTQD